MRSRYGPGASTVPGRSKAAMVAGSWPGGTWPAWDWNIVNAALPALGPQRSVDLVVDAGVLAGVGQHAGQRWLMGDHDVNSMPVVPRQVQR